MSNKISFFDQPEAPAQAGAEMGGDILSILMQAKDALSQGDVDSAMQLLDQAIQAAGGEAQMGAEVAAEQPQY